MTGPALSREIHTSSETLRAKRSVKTIETLRNPVNCRWKSVEYRADEMGWALHQGMVTGAEWLQASIGWEYRTDWGSRKMRYSVCRQKWKGLPGIMMSQAHRRSGRQIVDSRLNQTLNSPSGCWCQSQDRSPGLEILGVSCSLRLRVSISVVLWFSLCLGWVWGWGLRVSGFKA